MTVMRASMLTLAGGMGLGSVGVILKWAFANDYPFLYLTLLPTLLAVILIWVMWLREHRREMAAYSAGQVWKMRLSLMAWGGASGVSTLFYFLAIQQLPVAIATVLAVQYFWMIPVWKDWIEPAWARGRASGVQGFLFALLEHHPSKQMVLSWSFILFGTFWAMELHLISQWDGMSKWGILFGLLTGVADSLWMSATGRIHTHLSEETRSACIMTGGALSLIVLTPVLLLVGGFGLLSGTVDWQLGGVVGLIAVVGFLIPNWSFAKGMTYLFDKGKSALASCLPAVELPFGILAAMVLLSETVGTVQWLGICLILLGITYQTFAREEQIHVSPDRMLEATTYVRLEIVLANLRNPEYISDYIRQQVDGQKTCHPEPSRKSRLKRLHSKASSG